tara:strand:- start:537 stop:716 length:180 start_codon:yes stop_codon:yes gene_type:complete
MKHFYNNAKEYLKMTEEDKKYRQGRSKFRVEQTEKVAGWSIVGCLVCFILIALFSHCTL